MASVNRMSGLELRASLALASVFGLRLFGMFVILPVFAIYSGYRQAEPVAGAGSVALLISILLFWWAIFSARNSKAV